MLKCTSSLLHSATKIKWPPGRPSRIKEALERSGSDYSARDSGLVAKYYLSHRNEELFVDERRLLLNWLHALKDHKNVFLIGKKFLFDAGTEGPTLHQNVDYKKRVQCGRLRDDATLREIRTFMNSMVHEKKGILLDAFMEEIIAQQSIKNKIKVIKIINSVLDRMVTIGLPTSEVVIKWAKWMTLLNGDCEFYTYIDNKVFLKKLLYLIKTDANFKDPSSSVCIDLLQFMMDRQGSTVAAQLGTTLMTLLSREAKYQIAEGVWKFKIVNNLPIVKSDLTNIMKAYCYTNNYEKAKLVHEEHEEAHDENQQFDYLLLAHSKLRHWDALQKEFDGLFGIGELPNINQYGIIMNALAQVGEVESVEKLYSQLLRRNMLPSLKVLQALLIANFESGNFSACLTQFEYFKKYGIKPTSLTYKTMLKVYRNLANIDNALKMLKQMSKENPECVNETHISIVISMCSKTTNPLIAQELFDIMINHYSISPTGRSVSSLMKVYRSSSLLGKSLQLFKKYAVKEPVSENIILIYNEALRAYTDLGDSENYDRLFKEILDKNIKVEEGFYRSVLHFMATLSQDLEGAKETLMKLCVDPSVKALPSHFEILMKAYMKRSNYKEVINLYAKMNEYKIPVSSKVLFYLIKANFEIQLNSDSNLDSSINFVNNILTNTANKTLNMTVPNLHPAIIAYPMRVLAKFDNPSKSLQLLENYSNLFPNTNNRASINDSFSVMRSLLILCAEVNEWDDFSLVFEKYIDKIEHHRNLPSATTPNLYLSKLMLGLLKYKVEECKQKNSIDQLPKLLERIKKLGLEVDNHSINVIVTALCKDTRTIMQSINIVNNQLIHGYNLIRKTRLLQHISKENHIYKEKSWLLQQKENNPGSFIPKIYLKPDTLNVLSESLDSYLNDSDDIIKAVRDMINKNKYFMKTYLMHPRNNIERWDSIKDEFKEYLEYIQTNKRSISIDELNKLKDQN
ncbi:hypothetical protein TPHA_0P00210 [Tetrapisispora phaffii CBS 4417]|uniref:Pentacotripeptide-repeat region of PRORP domain-containing protein n=1 Tax=Tetrapisispora phaffii (strain ATCC 24235 / CBS 4417 / NBRC 1672 / NRRL Y-8282 / UCD 70-5) TaxID=1071381 RepID=G8C201_TETPH|nr:hypothetical protein TPHA_0P00210 [Tetrapisispora phaffii CBS 4417]CCE66179.1 hypothetical protein TPHA_0P00210 [Tetrapisispora phaffii CBS 4417]